MEAWSPLMLDFFIHRWNSSSALSNLAESDAGRNSRIYGGINAGMVRREEDRRRQGTVHEAKRRLLNDGQIVRFSLVHGSGYTL